MGLLTTTFYDDYFPLFKQDKSGAFDEVASSAGLPALTKSYLGWACGLADFRNNGQRDFWAANGHVYPLAAQYFQPFTVFQNDGGAFSLGYKYPATPNNSYRGGCQGDFNNDGRMDVLVLPIAGQPLLFANKTSNNNSWIGLKLRGMRSNRDAIGASVRIEHCGKKQFDTARNGGSYISGNDSRLHFGLGSCGKVDKVTVKWPRGVVQVFGDVAANKYTTLEEAR